MRKSLIRKLLIAFCVLIGVSLVSAYSLHRYYSPGTPVDPVVAGAGPSVSMMDFSKPPSVDPVSKGWFHVKFLTKPAMQISFVSKQGRDSLRCETIKGGSIFGRFTDIDLVKFPMLKWGWFVEQPVVSDVPEDVAAGDDHPVRFLIQFEDSKASDHAIEIIWSNGKFKKGDWKIIGNFHHYVADGGDAKSGENLNVWFDESVNLLELYRTATGRSDDARLKYISVFCDTDDTKTKSTAYVSSVELRQAE